MKSHPELETRPHAPILIPQRELILHLPPEWAEAIRSCNLSVAHMLKTLICGMEKQGTLRDNWEAVFNMLEECETPPAEAGTWVETCVVMTEEMYQCFLSAAAQVAHSPREVACRILARQIPKFADPELDRVVERWEKAEVERKKKGWETQALQIEENPIRICRVRHRRLGEALSLEG